MRTHVSAKEFWDFNPCDDYPLDKIEGGMGTEPITLEALMAIGWPAEDMLWGFRMLMNDEERLRFAWEVLNEAELANPQSRSRAGLTIVKNWLEGRASDRILEAGHATTQAWVKANQQGKVPLPELKQVDAVCNLMGNRPPNKRAALACRLVLGTHPNANFEHYADIAIKILKGEL